MARNRPGTCKHCGLGNGDRHPDGEPVGLISWRGNCDRHGHEALNTNIDQMHARRGPNWTSWRMGMIRVAGGHFKIPTRQA